VKSVKSVICLPHYPARTLRQLDSMVQRVCGWGCKTTDFTDTTDRDSPGEGEHLCICAPFVQALVQTGTGKPGGNGSMFTANHPSTRAPGFRPHRVQHITLFFNRGAIAMKFLFSVVAAAWLMLDAAILAALTIALVLS
jgi:hypothetical protein